MSYLEALILGIVQGVFMFVPVSSTAHLVLTQHLMIGMGSDLPAPESPQMILFDLVVHVGTLVSIALVFRRSLLALIRAAGREVVAALRPAPDGPAARTGLRASRPFLWLILMGGVTVAVTGVLGLSLRRYFELVFATPQMLVLTLSVTALLLFLTDRLSRRPLGVKAIGLRIAVVIGIAQTLALIPGISRSGMTIIAGLFSGLKRRWAAEYSFLVAIPTILAASLVQSLDVWRGDGLDGVGAGALLVGFVTAALVGTVALRLVLAALYHAQLKIFSAYLLLLAALVGFGVLDAPIFTGAPH